MCKFWGEKIGGMIGEVLDVQENNKKLVSESFLRIKIKIEIRKPLSRRVFVKLKQNKNPQWFYIQYERLPNFYYS